jgi:hypothetical protein
LYAALDRRHRNQARGGIGMGHFIIERPRVNDDIFSIEVESEAVKASGNRAIQVLAVGPS